jgi:uncharacterized repeat protein (TIGR03803 family)
MPAVKGSKIAGQMPMYNIRCCTDSPPCPDSPKIRHSEVYQVPLATEVRTQILRLSMVITVEVLACVLGAKILAAQPMPASQTYSEVVLYSFSGGSDGGYPYSGLILDRAGNLYGTTGYGGELKCNKGQGCGTVFKVDLNGNETVLHKFTGTRDGAYPYTGLIRDTAGNFYGTTEGGGTYGNGTVFKLEPSGRETLLYSFTGGADGAVASSGLTMDSGGNLYGTTFSGGTYKFGNVFKLAPGGQLTVLYSFTGGTDGSGPTTGLVMDSVGNF